MTKVLCCKSLPSRWRIGSRSFSRSFNARARRVSAKEISRRFSKPSSANKPREGICRVKESSPLTLILSPQRGEANRGACCVLAVGGPDGRLSFWVRGEGEGEELVQF